MDREAKLSALRSRVRSTLDNEQGDELVIASLDAPSGDLSDVERLSIDSMSFSMLKSGGLGGAGVIGATSLGMRSSCAAADGGGGANNKCGHKVRGALSRAPSILVLERLT